MCDKTTNIAVATQQVPSGLVDVLLMTAERELAAFYTAVVRSYGPEEASKAVFDWIEAAKTMDWSANGAVPNWCYASTVAADRLASRVIEHSPEL
jgi:hypothetical protein